MKKQQFWFIVFVAIFFWSITTLAQEERPFREKYRTIIARNHRLLAETFDIEMVGETTNILSTSDSLNVEVVGRWANGLCYGVAVKGDTAYFGNGGYLEIVDFSNTANPVELGKILVPAPIRGIVVSGGYAYVAGLESSLRVIDVSDPRRLFEAGYFDTRGYASDVALSNGYAYVADGSDGLRVIDISDPTSPFEAGFFNADFRKE